MTALTPAEALAFVRREGIVLHSARGRVPNLAETVAGVPIRGSWWGHPRGQEIFQAAEAVSGSKDVLVCRLVGGKVTYVHRRLWPALVRLAERFPPESLARVWSEHTARGHHESRSLPFPQWVPKETAAEAALLSDAEAETVLATWLPEILPSPPRPRASPRAGRRRRPPRG